MAALWVGGEVVVERAGPALMPGLLGDALSLVTKSLGFGLLPRTDVLNFQGVNVSCFTLP